MLITPRPGAQRDTIIRDLADISLKAGNLRSGGGPYSTADDWLLAYLQWATDAIKHLRYEVSDADIDRLVLTRRYYALLGCSGSPNQPGLLNGLIGLELDERVDALDTVVAALKETAKRWSAPGWYVVADSSFFIQNADRLEKADLHAVLGLPTGVDIHLLLPIVVVDELDALKDASKARPRWRAGHTLGLLDSVLGDSGRGILRRPELPVPGGEDSVRGTVSVEIVFDPAGHTRLPHADDEIIDRALAIRALSGQEVRLLTCDTGQSTRARTAGLKVTKVPAEDLGEEPDWAKLRAEQDRAGTGTRAKRRARQRAEAEAAEEEPGVEQREGSRFE